MSPLDQFDVPSRLNPAHLNRREFMTLMGASVAFAGLQGCRNKLPMEEIIPYSVLPGDHIAGRPRFFATTFPVPGFVQGLLVESHEGHPTKIEGNPAHPASRGATGLFAQASILDLYSPFRLKTPIRGADKNTGWPKFREELSRALDQHAKQGGTGLALLTGEVTSPTLRFQIGELLRTLPAARWFVDEPTREAQNRFGRPSFNFHETKRILSIDCDFLGLEPNAVANAGEYTAARRASGGINRLYLAEPGISVTGAKADHRWSLSTTELEHFFTQLEMGLFGNQSEVPPDIRALANDLAAHRGESLILGGFALSNDMHRRIQAMNSRLGNIGKTLSIRQASALQSGSIASLTSALHTREIESVIVIGGNPVFTSPRDIGFGAALSAAGFSAHLTESSNETSAACTWALPASHYLESWSDAESDDGTESLIQPLLSPMGDSVNAHRLLSWLSSRDESEYDLVRNYWRTRTGGDFEAAWRKALEGGKWTQTPSRGKTAKAVTSTPPLATPKLDVGVSPFPASGLEIIFRPDPTIWDGRFAENPWLQELPKPTTQLCWDNALLVPVGLANKNKISDGDLLLLKTAYGTIEVAALVTPGLPDGTLSLALGYGRENSGPVAKGCGFDANRLRSSRDPWRAPVISLEKTGRKYELAVTQSHHDTGGRELIGRARPDEALAPRKAPADPGSDIGDGTLGSELPLSMRNSHEQWAMSIDTDSCIGCAVCVIACQAENNIPTVGKKMVLMGREMHWIRIDRYTSGADARATLAAPIPVTCMHCEKAPCEVVCPVGATTHSSTGLNQMVYNRCVGTRYCSNNCPYKVRRFNFYKFSENMDGPLSPQRNPEVTVRSRGVMEKCSYCVQRIERARIESSKANRRIRDGEILTACQQACPTKAIMFGNLADPESAIHATRSTARAYGLLTELGTRPRTTYLKLIANPNPDFPRSK